MGGRARKKAKADALARHLAAEAASEANLSRSARGVRGSSRRGNPGRVASKNRRQSGLSSPRPFSLADEARNTGLHERGASYSNLRSARITFVKATTPPVGEDVDEPTHTPLDRSMSDSKSATESTKARHILTPSHSSHANPMAEDISSLYVVDPTRSSTPVHTGLPDPVVRASSPASSTSSEEVIVFKGRNRSGATEAKVADSDEIPSRPHSEPPVTSVDSRADDANSATFHSLAFRPHGMLSSDLMELNRGHPRQQAYPDDSSVDEEVAADYMNNVRASKYLYHTTEDEQGEERPRQPQPSGLIWSSDDLEDLGDISTSSEMGVEVGRIYSKRERPSGPQYLVVGKGLSPDDARWMKGEWLTSADAKEQIRVFEENERRVPQISESSDDISANDLDDTEDMKSSTSPAEEDHDLSARAIKHMTDEQLAMRLSKQEELGLPADEVILFGGDDDLDKDDEGLDDDKDEMQQELWEAVQSLSRNPNRRAMKERSTDFPSASAFADILSQDPYGGFDVMDRERPSIRRKSMSKRAMLDFDLSDVELKAKLQTTWEKDRENKKLKKREREELRLLGLVGEARRKPAWNTGYDSDVEIDDVKMQIKSFLLSLFDELALPPLDNADRLVVHKIAHVFQLSSRSHGKEPNRYPLLSKTFSTPAWKVVEIDRKLKLFRNWLPKSRGSRNPERKKKSTAARAAGARGHNGHAAASYKDGDVVGAAAPEIGIDNRGRAMLEKMGWSKGMALGALDNKGIMLPVAHVVKNSKAGLG